MTPRSTALEAAFEEAVVLRTRFFDDFGTSAASNGCTQVVLVGAGLDTRAFRLAWPDGLRVFELDLPDVLDFKNRILSEESAEPTCERITVPLDLQHPDWPARLTNGSFDPASRTAWIAEGFLPYLGHDEAEHLLAAVGRLSSTGSVLALDHAGGANDSLSQARALPSMEEIAAMWKGGLGGDVALWLAHHGWKPETIVSGTLSARYERKTTEALHGEFVTATRI